MSAFFSSCQITMEEKVEVAEGTFFETLLQTTTLQISNISCSLCEGSLIGLLQSLSRDTRNGMLFNFEMFTRGEFSRTMAETIISAIIPSAQISIEEIFRYVEVLTGRPESWIRIRRELENREISTQEAAEEQQRTPLDEHLSQPRPRTENASRGSGEVSSLTNPSSGSPVRTGLPQNGTADVPTAPTSTVVGTQGGDSEAAFSLDSNADQNQNNTPNQSPVRPRWTPTRNLRDDASFITTDRSPAGASTTATSGSSAPATLNTSGTAGHSFAARSNEHDAVLTVQNTISVPTAVAPATNYGERDASIPTPAQNTADMANKMCCLIQ